MSVSFNQSIFAGILCLGVLIGFSAQAASYGGGSGTAENPYQIRTPEQMNTIGVNPADWGKHFILMNNLDMSAYTGTQYKIIGEVSAPFTGVFDGNGHVIANLTIAEAPQNYAGLFGYVGFEGQVKNLGIENVNITGTAIVGGLAGGNEGALTSCYVTGSVSSSSSIGGLVGENDYEGVIMSCWADVSVSGFGSSYYNNVGGLAGWNGGIIISSYATGTVSGSGCVGGLVGANGNYEYFYFDDEDYGAVILFCYAAGSVEGSGTAGGLAGSNNADSIIASSYALGSVDGSEYVGGLAGGNNSGSVIISCYAAGPVSGYDYVGGLVGQNDEDSMITSCYAAGSVSGSSYVGGLVGKNSYETFISSSYAAGSVTGSSYVGGLVGRNEQGVISSCYATGSVDGSEYVGGLAGWNLNDPGHNYYHNILYCYAAGLVSGSDYVGGLVGWDKASWAGSLAGWYNTPVIFSFWDIETSGLTTSAGGIGRTTAGMQTLSTFTQAGWDFAGESSNGTEEIWRMCQDGIDYPRLSWEFAPAGDFACPDGVGLEDLFQLAMDWLTTGTPLADSNFDGIVDLQDMTAMSVNWVKMAYE